MCTVIVGFDPDAAVPLLVVGVRDEYLARPWRSPAHHWAARPGLVGGIDLQSGGTWLAVAPGVPRVGCVLNAFGAEAAVATRLTRGRLPLLAAGGGEPFGEELTRFDPFHLVRADADQVLLWTWDGATLAERPLAPGLHMILNSGLEGERAATAPPQAAEDMAARLAYFRPRLEAAKRPEPGTGMSVEEAWGEWLPLVSGAGLPAADPAALLVRRDFGDEHLWGSSSVSLVALGPAGTRYDFGVVPDEGAFTWSTVS
ncbi:NRDE family protein [Hamadaea tsunoensis]|uniref:NRDE family protein n=1 Tax=Hamadaea tsunoensis TaxID=53368 RepID=UPI000411C9E5|nr:NRDE family protein [Hamadaea tsunoensis]